MTHRKHGLTRQEEDELAKIGAARRLAEIRAEAARIVRRWPDLDPEFHQRRARVIPSAAGVETTDGRSDAKRRKLRKAARSSWENLTPDQYQARLHAMAEGRRKARRRRMQSGPEAQS